MCTSIFVATHTDGSHQVGERHPPVPEVLHDCVLRELDGDGGDPEAVLVLQPLQPLRQGPLGPGARGDKEQTGGVADPQT